jgi:class 3 adenylate cyclase
MFSDLVGSTALSARMDPEDLREIISSYQKCVAETVQRCSIRLPLRIPFSLDRRIRSTELADLHGALENFLGIIDQRFDGDVGSGGNGPCSDRPALLTSNFL